MAEKEQVAKTEATKETTEKVEVNEPKEATFTQSQVNNIIKSRLESEKAKQQKALEEQKKLVESGASKTMKSKHLEGNAFDFMVFLGPRVCWELKFYDDVGDAIVETAKGLGIKQLKWGGAWHIDNILEWDGTLLEAHNAYCKLRSDQGRTPFVDMPHFQKGV